MPFQLLWLWAELQYVSLAFEVLAPALFLIARLRPLAIVLGIGFHLVIALMMKDLIFFSIQMWSFYVLFVPVRRLAEKGTALTHSSRPQRVGGLP